MASLEELPDELIIAVVDYLSFTSLPNLNRVNHRFHNLTTPHLYTTFAGPKAQQFLRTITSPLREERDLAQHVKKVQWRAYADNVHDRTGARARIKRCIPTSERQPVVRAYQQLGLRVPPDSRDPPLDVLFTRDLIPYEHWYLEFFLSFLPNVSDLEVHDTWQWNNHRHWFTHFASNIERFKCLKTVTMHGPLRLPNVTPLLELPRIRSLELHRVIVMRIQAHRSLAWDMDEPNHYPLKAGSIALESLALKKSYIKAIALKALLHCIKSLKSFTYEHVRHRLSHPINTQLVLDYSQLGSALAGHAGTLTSLRIHDERDEGMLGLIQVLTHLPALEELDIRLPQNAAEALTQTSTSPVQIDVDMWIEKNFPSAPLHTLKVWTKNRKFQRSFWHHCSAPTCKQFADSNALNSIVVLHALAKRGLKRVCLAFRDEHGHVPSLSTQPWLEDFAFTKGVFASAGLEFVLVDYDE